MRVSLNSIKQYTDVNISIDELIEKINTRLGGVEEVTHLGERYKDALIVRVTKCEKHPNADRLTVCLVDDGGAAQGVERDSDGLVQVVCGAPNARVGMLAVWLPPNSIVPASFDDKEPFLLLARELRGVMSSGMLASASELAISDDHSGIIEIDESDLRLPSGDTAQGQPLDALVGKSFAEVFKLDDILIDIENKMFTHRPDLFGQLGVAREVAGIQGEQFTSPGWYIDEPSFHSEGDLGIEVFNDTPDKASRFMSVVLSDIEVGPSPLWLQSELLRLGAKSVNNIVDITNYVMLTTSQPVHAYDYDELRGQKLGVRLAREGETLTLLNDKTYNLDVGDMVIADGEGAIGLAGVMGGKYSEVTSETKNIALEVATFDMFTIRRTSMRHGLFTEAVTRFSKGQSPLQNDRSMGLLISLLIDVAGAKQVSEVVDRRLSEHEIQPTSVTSDFINSRLGLSLSGKDIQQLLGNVEVEVGVGADEDMSVKSPFWRTDIELPEDVVEEVGRLYGFDNLPRELPKRSIRPTSKNHMRELKQSIRETLSSAGANEILTYSFVHGSTLANVGQDPKDSYEITNSLSPDLQYYRQSLTPSLISHTHANIKAGYDSFALFELGKVHSKKFGLDPEGLPLQQNQMAFTFGSKVNASGAAFYRVKYYMQTLLRALGVEADVRDLNDNNAVSSPFEPKRAAMVVDAATGESVGVVGEYRQSVCDNFKLPKFAAGFELNLDRLIESASGSLASRYEPLSRYPSLTRDVCFKVSFDTTYSDLVRSIDIKTQGDVRVGVDLIDIYKDSEKDEFKQVTFRVRMINHQKTLTSKDADGIMSALAGRAAEAVQAVVI